MHALMMFTLLMQGLPMMLKVMILTFIPIDPTQLFEFISQLFPALAPIFSQGWSTIGTMTIAIMALEELIDKRWHLDGYPAMGRTIAMGAVFGFLGYILNMGIFGSAQIAVLLGGTLPQWIQAMIVGFYATLVAMFAHNVPLFKFIMELLKIRVPAVDPAPPKKAIGGGLRTNPPDA